MGGDTATEEQLLHDFRELGGLADLRLVQAVRPMMRKLVRTRYPSLAPLAEDLTQDVLVELTALRAEHREKQTGKPRPPLWELLSRLVNKPAKAAQREARRAAPLTDDHPSAARDLIAALDARRLAGLLQRLPEGQAEVIVHHAAAELGEGPPLHEALGTTRQLASMRLAYARKLLHAAAAGGRDD